MSELVTVKIYAKKWKEYKCCLHLSKAFIEFKQLCQEFQSLLTLYSSRKHTQTHIPTYINLHIWRGRGYRITYWMTVKTDCLTLAYSIGFVPTTDKPTKIITHR